MFQFFVKFNLPEAADGEEDSNGNKGDGRGENDVEPDVEVGALGNSTNLERVHEWREGDAFLISDLVYKEYVLYFCIYFDSTYSALCLCHRQVSTSSSGLIYVGIHATLFESVSTAGMPQNGIYGIYREAQWIRTLIGRHIKRAPAKE